MIVPSIFEPSQPVLLRGTRYQVQNIPRAFETPENVQDFFAFTAPSNSQITRDALSQTETTAPMMLTNLQSAFILAEVTVSAELELDRDQGGLVIFVDGAPRFNSTRAATRHGVASDSDRTLRQHRDRWTKVGLEFTGGELGVSTVVANSSDGVDWSFTPAFPCLTAREAFSMPMPSIRVKLEKVGFDLWVWYRIPDDAPSSVVARSPEMLSRHWKKCREVSAFFDEATSKGDIWVGCYASRPMDLEECSADEGLYVEFEDLEVL